MKKNVGICVLFTLLSLLVVSCSFRGTAPSPPPTSGVPPTTGITSTVGITPTTGLGTTPTSPIGGSHPVDLAAMSFVPNSITIKKGDSILLKNQTPTVHIISNGTWNGNTPMPQTEAGAPVVNSMMFNTTGDSKTIGPFNTAGTFHYYCSVHQGMNLTVIVN
ncbi:MAG: cupredoxin domain-containing protein [Ktedonobacteraceae bacterium]